MTQKGESMTIKGELQAQLPQTASGPFQILSLRREGDEPVHITDISDTFPPDHNFTDTGYSDEDNFMAHMIFSIACSADNKITATDKFPPFREYEHNMMLFQSRNILKDQQERNGFELLCVRMDLRFLHAYLPLSKPVFNRFCNCIETGAPAMLSDTHLTISPKITNILNNITTCSHQGFYKKLYLEAKVIELLALQFEQYEELINNTSNIALELSDDILEKINKVRLILINDINTKLSLKELANKVGTNEYTLKTGFKKVFGNTVFGFLHQFKMEKARKMLLEQDVRIAEVSNEMGYKHATHFTNAFKKYFGYLPNKIALYFLVPFNLVPDHLLGL